MPSIKSKDDKLAYDLRLFHNSEDFSVIFEEATGVKLEDKEVKACLLQLTYLTYNEKKENYLMKRDIVLVSWGLLKEYPDILPITERRRQYIKDTGYIGRYKYDRQAFDIDEGSDEYKENLKAAMQNIIQHEYALYPSIAEYYNKNLLKDEALTQFVDTAKDKWISHETGEVALPSRSDYGLDTAEPVEPNEPDEPSEPDNTNTQTNHDKKFGAAKFIIVYAVIAVLVIISMMFTKAPDKQTSRKISADEFEDAIWAMTETQAPIYPDSLTLYSTDKSNYGVYNDWGDSDGGRRLYTLDEVNKGELKDAIVLNSISNSSIGDESKFVGARNADSPYNTWTNDVVTVKDGKTYTICLLIHNDNPGGLQAIAEGVKATFLLPEELASTSQIVYGYIDSTNATPTHYWDTVTFVSDDYFCLEYVEGSARYTNSSIGTISISDDVVSNGYPLGYDRFDGHLPGGDKYQGVVTIDVVAKRAEPSLMNVSARLDGTKARNGIAMEANVGDTIEYVIEYCNNTDSSVQDVIIRDELQDGLEYIEGSTKLYNYHNQEGKAVSDDLFGEAGLNIGNYDPRGNAVITFKAKVAPKTLADERNTLMNTAYVEADDSEPDAVNYSDWVTVTIYK